MTYIGQKISSQVLIANFQHLIKTRIAESCIQMPPLFKHKRLNLDMLLQRDALLSLPFKIRLFGTPAGIQHMNIVLGINKTNFRWAQKLPLNSPDLWLHNFNIHPYRELRMGHGNGEIEGMTQRHVALVTKHKGLTMFVFHTLRHILLKQAVKRLPARQRAYPPLLRANGLQLIELTFAQL